MNLAEKLTYLRKKHGLTQMELAERLNVSRQAISRWEVGTAVPTVDNLVVLGKLYCVSVDYLLDDEISENRNESHESENIATIDAAVLKYRKFRLLLILCALIIIIALILHYLPMFQNENSGQSVLIDDLCVETGGAHANGTFVIE